jgi:hypothetical protein
MPRARATPPPIGGAAGAAARHRHPQRLQWLESLDLEAVHEPRPRAHGRVDATDFFSPLRRRPPTRGAHGGAPRHAVGARRRAVDRRIPRRGCARRRGARRSPRLEQDGRSLWWEGEG